MSHVITVTPNPALDITMHATGWKRGRVNRGESVHVTPGGKGLTVALNLADAGIHSVVTGWMGEHNDGPFRRAFISHGIKDDFVRYEGDIRRCVKIVDKKSGETTDINMPGHEVPAEAVKALDDYLDEHVTEKTALIFGGSLPQGIKANYYAKMVEKFRDRCAFLLVDTSDKALTALMKGKKLPHIIKPNIHELEELTGKQLDDEDEIIKCAKEFIAAGVRLAVISAGERGAWFIREDEAVFAKPPSVSVASTVGAGDAMVAGTVRGLLLGRSLSEIAETATAYSVGNIMKVGVQLPSIGEIEALKKRIEVRKVY